MRSLEQCKLNNEIFYYQNDPFLCEMMALMIQCIEDEKEGRKRERKKNSQRMCGEEYFLQDFSSLTARKIFSAIFSSLSYTRSFPHPIFSLSKYYCSRQHCCTVVVTGVDIQRLRYICVTSDDDDDVNG